MEEYNLISFVMKYSMVRKRIAAKYLKKEDLNGFESILLSIVYKHQELSQDKIGEMTLSDGASITRSLKKLEDRGFVSRKADPNNGRKKIVRITDEGQTLYDQVREEFHTSNVMMFNDVTSEEQHELERILTKVYKNLDNLKIESK